MSEFLPGGRRRIDRVLAPEYLEGVDRLTLEEVRARRAEADQEEVDLSYARRLLQGRIDILRAEQERRRAGSPTLSGQDDEAIVEMLTRVLTDGPRRDHGGGRHMTATPSRVGEHRREAERAVADVGGSDLAALDDLELTEAIERLADIERRVSRSRRSVQGVVDALTGEVARRYRLDEVSLAEH